MNIGRLLKDPFLDTHSVQSNSIFKEKKKEAVRGRRMSSLTWWADMCGCQQQKQSEKPDALHVYPAAVNSDFCLRLTLRLVWFWRCPGWGALPPCAYFGTSFSWRCRGNWLASPCAVGVGGHGECKLLCSTSRNSQGFICSCSSVSFRLGATFKLHG